MKDLEKVLEIILLRAEWDSLSSKVKMFSVLLQQVNHKALVSVDGLEVYP